MNGSKLCPHSQTGKVVVTLLTPLGNYIVEACSEGIHEFLPSNDTKDSKNFDVDVQVEIKPCVEQAFNKENTCAFDDDHPIVQCKTWMETYFRKPELIPTLPPPSICFSAIGSTEFERHVWKTLASCTEMGKTISYGELADQAGNPKAARAVGSAMKKNPVCILVPCHRVVRSDGSIGQYNGGAGRKEWLIDHEKSQSKEPES